MSLAFVPSKDRGECAGTMVFGGQDRLVIRRSPDVATDKGEIRLLFDWQDALRPIRP